MRRLRKIAVLLPLALLLGLTALVSTHVGQTLLLRLASSLASSDAIALQIGALDGSLFGDGTISDIALSDKDGVWLKAHDVAYSWSPRQLASGHLDVASLRIGKVSILRKPVPRSGSASQAKSEHATTGLPLRLRLGELNIRQIDVGASIAGEAVKLHVSGSAKIEDIDEAMVRFHVARLDGVGATLDAKIAAVRASHSLTLAVNGTEPEGGFLSVLLGLPSRPPVSLKIDGRGTLDAFNAELALAAAGKPFVAGNVNLTDQGNGTHRLGGTAAGYVEALVPSIANELFAGKTDLIFAADVTGLADGVARTIGNAKFALTSSNLRVEAAGGGDLAELSFHGNVEGRAFRADGVPLHFGSDIAHRFAVDEMAFEASLPDTPGPRRLTAKARIDGFTHSQFAARSMAMTMQATSPANWSKSPVLNEIAIDLVADGVDETRAAGKAFGSESHAWLTGSFDGNALNVSSFDVKTATAALQMTGRLKGAVFKGNAHIDADNLALLSGLIGRQLAGRAAMQLAFEGNLDTSALRTAVQGKTVGISLGQDIANRLLVPETTLGGEFDYTSGGALVVRNATITNELLKAAFDGKIDEHAPGLSGHVGLASLSALSPHLAGAAQLDISLAGSASQLRSTLSVTGERVMLNGRAVDKPSLRFAGQGPLEQHTGTVKLSASIAGEPLDGSAQINASSNGSLSIAILTLDFAGATLTGNMAALRGKLPTGNLTFDAPSLERLGKATGARLQGRTSGNIALADEAEGGGAEVDVTAEGIVVGDLRVDGARAKGKVAGYLSAPLGTIDVSVARVSNSAYSLTDLNLETRFNRDAARLAGKLRFNGGTFNMAGNVRSANEALAIDVTSASYVGGSELPNVRLSAPAQFSYGDGRLALGDIRIGVGGGTLRVTGSLGADAVDTRIALQNVPASVVEAVAPGLGVNGTISGNTTVSGALSAPAIDAKIVAKALSTNDMRSQHLPSIDVSTTVTAAASVANVDVRATGRGGLNLSVSGTVAMKGNAALDLSGKGEVPLALANVFLAERGTGVVGVAKVAAQISGAATAPRIDGTITVKGAKVSDPGGGLELSAIDAEIDFSQKDITIRNLTATSKMGGSITGEGSVELNHGTQPSANISIRLAGFKFGNQDPVAGDIDGAMTVSGPVRSLVARGDLYIKRMDISVPNQVPQSVASLDIRHINAPAGFGADSRRRDAGDQASAADTGMTLALDVHAADRIFIRGRGVDAQLGGDVKIRGTSAKPVTDGQFAMSRGRLTIIGRQLDFSRGNIVFTGGLEPSLDMEAKADADGTTVIVIITGPASRPMFKFTSTPELPEDEVVSLLLFNKKLAKLSAAQLVQLASEIDKIGGLSSGPSTLDQMKKSLGIDVLDVSTDAKGNAQATAGSYINDQTYVGVKQGTSLGTGRVVIDHNLTKNLKARGEVGSNGDSKLGLGFEWEY